MEQTGEIVMPVSRLAAAATRVTEPGVPVTGRSTDGAHTQLVIVEVTDR